jgi:hypothetical protein
VDEELGEKQAACGETLQQLTLVGEQVAYYETRIEELGAIEASLEEI